MPQLVQGSAALGTSDSSLPSIEAFDLRRQCRCTEDNSLGGNGETMNGGQEQRDSDESSLKSNHICKLMFLV